jgi:hypothetical protein
MSELPHRREKKTPAGWKNSRQGYLYSAGAKGIPRGRSPQESSGQMSLLIFANPEPPLRLAGCTAGVMAPPVGDIQWQEREAWSQAALQLTKLEVHYPPKVGDICRITQRSSCVTDCGAVFGAINCSDSVDRATHPPVP